MKYIKNERVGIPNNFTKIKCITENCYKQSDTINEITSMNGQAPRKNQPIKTKSQNIECVIRSLTS